MQKILDHDMSQTIKFRRVELSSHKCTCKSKVQNVLQQSALLSRGVLNVRQLLNIIACVAAGPRTRLNHL